MKLDPIEWLNLSLSSAAVVTGLALGSRPFAASIALGAAIEAVNFRMLRAASLRLFAGDLGVGRAWMAGFGLRFAALGVAMALALSAGAHPVGLVLGLSTIVPAVLIGAWLQRPPPQVCEPGPPPDDPSWETWNPWLARERDPSDDEDRS